jgi:hypothetical protein
VHIQVYLLPCTTVNSNSIQHITYKMLKRTSFSIHPRCMWIDVQYSGNRTFKIILEAPSAKKSIKRWFEWRQGKARQALLVDPRRNIGLFFIGTIYFVVRNVRVMLNILWCLNSWMYIVYYGKLSIALYLLYRSLKVWI